MNSSQYAGLPARHGPHRPHESNDMHTWSPTATDGDALADRFHDTGALVAGDDRRADEVQPGARHDIGVAHAGADDTDQHLPGTGFGEVDRFDGVGAGGVTQDGCVDLHHESPFGHDRRLSAAMA